MSAWLALTVGFVLGHAPWIKGIICPYLTALGLLALLVGLALFLKDIWRHPGPQTKPKRLLVIGVIGVVALVYVAWMTVLRLPLLAGELPPSFETLLSYEVISDHIALLLDASRDYLDELSWQVEENVFSYPVALVSGAIAASLVLALCCILFIVLRKAWTRDYEPTTVMRRWLVLLGTGLLALHMLDGYGLELVRRIGATVHVAVSYDRLSDYKPPPRVQYVRYTWTDRETYTTDYIDADDYESLAEGVEPPLADEERKQKARWCAPDIRRGLCYDVDSEYDSKGERYILEGSFGSGCLLRLADKDTPVTPWEFIDGKSRHLRSVPDVTLHPYNRPRHLYGPWHEVDTSIAFPLQHRKYGWGMSRPRP